MASKKDFIRVVTVRGESPGDCQRCKLQPMTFSSFDEAVNHYLHKHGFKVISVVSEGEVRDGNGKIDRVATLGEGPN